MSEAAGETFPNSTQVEVPKDTPHPFRQRIAERPEHPPKPIKSTEDTTKLYLDQLGQYPLLSKEQEFDLAEKIEAGNTARQQLDTQENLDDVAKKRLHHQVRIGNQAREQFINSNLRLVVSIAKKQQGRGVPLMDLIQEGNLGLIRAVEKFDRHQGFKFSTYATWWIRQAVGRGVEDKASNVRLPSQVRAIKKQTKKLQASLTEEFGRPPSASEMAEIMGISEARFNQIKNISLTEQSLNQKISDDSADEIGDFMPDQLQPSVEEAALTQVMQQEAMHMMDRAGLTSQEKKVLDKRFGLSDNYPRTLEQLGQEFGVTRERIRQVEAKALSKIREFKSSFGPQAISRPSGQVQTVKSQTKAKINDQNFASALGLLKIHTFSQVKGMMGEVFEGFPAELHRRGYSIVVDKEQDEQ